MSLSRAEPTETHTYDVVVIGAGGAGLRAAIAAAEAGARTAVDAESLLGKAQTEMGAAMAAALGEASTGDDWMAHFADTVRGGRIVNNWRMAELLAREAPARVLELEAWGALFDRAPDGRIAQAEGSGHRHPRLARMADRTGVEILRALQDQAVAHSIDIFVECVIVCLLKDGDRIAGADGVRKESGTAVRFNAPAVVLATGGIGKAYAITSNFADATGNGHALALDAGAELIDMEFIQFHPTGMVWPPSTRGLLVAESIRTHGGVLRNAAGERFMFRYIPATYREEIAETEVEADRWRTEPHQHRRPPELLPRDIVARAIGTEITAERGYDHGGVLLDIASRRPAEYIKRTLPHMYRQFLELADLDITKAPVEVAPTCHYAMGGIRVDADTGATRVAGLFAAGEVAGGLHGANRLNGNGISELLVFGRRAGESAARYARSSAPLNSTESMPCLDGAAACQSGDAGHASDPVLLYHALQECMQRYVGLVRTDEGLRHALEEILTLRAQSREVGLPSPVTFSQGWDLAIDLRSLLVVAEAIIRSALERRETRGAHNRADYADLDPQFARRSMIARRTRQGLEVVQEPVPDMPGQLRKLIEGAT